MSDEEKKAENSTKTYFLEKLIVPIIIALIVAAGNIFVTIEKFAEAKGNTQKELKKAAESTQLELQQLKNQMETTYSGFNVNVVSLFKGDLCSDNPVIRKRALIVLSSLDERLSRNASILTSYSLHDEDAQVRELSSLLLDELRGKVKEQKAVVKASPNKALSMDISKTEEIIQKGDNNLKRCLAVIESDNSKNDALITYENIRKKYDGDRKFRIYLASNKYYALVIGDPFKKQEEAETAIKEILSKLQPGSAEPGVICGVNWGDPIWVE